MPPATWDTIRAIGPVWFAHGAAALHHMPWAEKVDTLRKIGALCRDCLVTEFNFNNDRPEQDTPEFVFSVVSLYNTLFADVLRSPAAEEDKEACLHCFLLAEAITMLRNPRPSRIDYHATIPDWVLAADEAGCDTLGILPVVMEHGRVFLFTHVVRSRR